MEKKKVIIYIDWTDALAHLLYDKTYSEGKRYTNVRINRFFNELRNLNHLYDVEIHCVTGGTEDYLNISHNWIEPIQGLFVENGFPNVLKSVVTEYGGDVIKIDGYDENAPEGQKLKTTLVEKPLKSSNTLPPDELKRNIWRTFQGVTPEKLEKIEFISYKYAWNVRIKDEEMDEKTFDALYKRIKNFEGSENYDLYPYYCPGYGVEIDVFPKGLDKARAVESIHELFYKDTPSSEIAVEVFNDDWPNVGHRMPNASATPRVLYTASKDTYLNPPKDDATEKLYKNLDVPYMIGGHKIDNVSRAMREIADGVALKKEYDKGTHADKRRR